MRLGAMKKQSQNKPNFRNAKMKENLFTTKDYENETAFRLQKNKAKTNPISSKAKMNLKSLAGKSGHTFIFSRFDYCLS